MNFKFPLQRSFCFIFYTLFFSIIQFSTNAQVVISEFSAANQGSFISGFNGDDNEDWIELHNEGNTTIDLTGYFLSDRLGNPDKWEFPAGASIAPNGYLRVWCSGLDGFWGGDYHTSFKITQTRASEDIVLADPSGVVIDFNELAIPNQISHSYGKDSNGNWGISTNPTPGLANGTIFESYAEKPVMLPTAGFYSGQVTVNISHPSNTTVYYTTDGSRPNNTSTLYTGAIIISNTTVLRAVTISNNSNILPSFYTTNSYFINATHSVPVISVSGGSEINTLLSGNEIEPLAYIELFDEHQQEIDEGQGFVNKHGNDSWNLYDHRGFDWIMRDQTGYDDDVTGQIFPQKSRTEYQRLIFKAAANDNYSFEPGGAHVRDAYVHTLSQLADLEMDERTSRYCVVYINGEYWGVYDMREKVDDHDFTKYYYDQGKKWIDFIKTWGITWEEYGSITEWEDLRDYIFINDMSDSANYAYVEERLEVLSLIDYMILHAHIVSQDWLNWNTAWWRGRNPDGGAQKWRYILWDEDATFGHYVNYTGIPDETSNADPCNVEEITTDFEGHVEIFTSLYENENFKQLYINRYADLNNTFFSCDYMIGLLDSMIAVIEPEMPQQVNRWGGSIPEWESNVQDLKNFILGRCDVIDSGIVDCYEVTGPYALTINIEPANSPNKVKVNTIIPDQYPYAGDYFGGVNVDLEALPQADWNFSHWEVADLIFGANQYLEAISFAVEMEHEITAFFVQGIPCATPSEVAINSNFFGGSIDWDGAPNAISYEVRYRESGTTDWTSVSATQTTQELSGLQTCTNYDLEVRTVCQVSLSSFASATFQTECTTTSTSELEGSHIHNFNVFPNPFRDVLNLEFELAKSENVTFEIHNLHGQLLFEQPQGKINDGHHLFSIPLDKNWSDGMYLLRIVTDHGSVVKRVMKN